MKGQEGFSLVEVLLAASLVTVMLVPAAALAATAYRTLDRGGQATAAVAQGQQRIEWLRNQAHTSVSLDAGTTTEALTGTYAGYVRTTTIEDDVPRAGVKKVTVTVTTPSGLTAQIVALIAGT